jgi:alkanesulfonate monooxygenase SsuD/methylene tetrahydromethanopterin reductase-like flavin-dependent oxidoreductase (luciferase family)
MNEFEFGIYSLGERIPDPSGQIISAKSRIDDIIAAAKLADEAGLDLFGVGEHHRLDFVTSSYAMVLSAIAQSTKNIRLTSTLSVISTADPVRVFEDFATLDLISGGRTELIAGRGAFLESFELFGADLFQPKLPIWIGVGGTPESAARAGRLGLNMALGILGGDPRRVKPLVDIYRAAGKAAGHDPAKLRVSVTGHSYIAQTSAQALDEFHPHYVSYFSYFLKERGQRFWVSRSDLDAMTAPDNVLAVGSPQQLVEKILFQHELFGQSRFMGQFDMGGQPLSKVAKAIELLATEVAPVVRREIRKKQNIVKEIN